VNEYLLLSHLDQANDQWRNGNWRNGNMHVIGEMGIGEMGIGEMRGHPPDLHIIGA